jgi:hypothetical protein
MDSHKAVAPIPDVASLPAGNQIEKYGVRILRQALTAN